MLAPSFPELCWELAHWAATHPAKFLIGAVVAIWLLFYLTDPRW